MAIFAYQNTACPPTPPIIPVILHMFLFIFALAMVDAFLAAGCNYRGNAGVGPAGGTSAEHPDSGNGIFPEHEYVSSARVIDGLSHTAAFSERVRGSGTSDLPNPYRDFYGADFTVYTADTSVLVCRLAAHSTNASVFQSSGKWWFWTGRERTLYNHAQIPNGATPDCIHGKVTTAMAMATARSLHPGSVNVLMGDGSVRAVSQSVNVNVWRGLGTRNGGELVD